MLSCGLIKNMNGAENKHVVVLIGAVFALFL